jgi:hypothetical protein
MESRFTYEIGYCIYFQLIHAKCDTDGDFPIFQLDIGRNRGDEAETLTVFLVKALAVKSLL